MPMLDELASPHALAAAPVPAQQPRAPPFGAWDFARMGGVPPAALQQLLGPAAGLLVHQAQQARQRAVLGNTVSIQVGGPVPSKSPVRCLSGAFNNFVS